MSSAVSKDAKALMKLIGDPVGIIIVQCMMAKDQQRKAAYSALAGAIISRPQPQPYMLPMPGH